MWSLGPGCYSSLNITQKESLGLLFEVIDAYVVVDLCHFVISYLHCIASA